MAIRKVFHSHVPNSGYFTKNGFHCAFLGGRFETDNEEAIEELNAEIKKGHPYIYIKADDAEVDTDAPTPIELLKLKAKQEAFDEMVAAGLVDPEKASEYQAGNFAASTANSHTIAAAAAGQGPSTAGVKTINTNALAALAAKK